MTDQPAGVQSIFTARPFPGQWRGSATVARIYKATASTTIFPLVYFPYPASGPLNTVAMIRFLYVVTAAAWILREHTSRGDNAAVAFHDCVSLTRARAQSRAGVLRTYLTGNQVEPLSLVSVKFSYACLFSEKRFSFYKYFPRGVESIAGSVTTA